MKKLLFFCSMILLVIIFSVMTVSALTPGTGYVVSSDGQTTNIKWTMEEDGTLTFEIDASASDKVASTVIPNRDPVTGERGDWNKSLPSYTGAEKIIIGDGITSVSGFMCLDTLKSVEVPKSLVIADEQAFQGAYRCTAFYVRGTQPEDGTFDFRYMTTFKKMSFDSCCYIKKIIFNEALTGNLPLEFIKEPVNLTELTIPAGVTQLDDKSISKTDKLQVLTILGKNTVLQSKNVFGSNNSYPAIRAYADSKAAEFAKANGFAFIDIETEEFTAGTLPTSYSPSGGGNSSNSGGGTTTGGNTASEQPTGFDPNAATAWGHMTDLYNDNPIIDTYWAYYEDTKTLEFISNLGYSSYNETGNISTCDEGYGDWSEYKDIIEHVIVGDNIDKLSGEVCSNMKALKDIRLGNNVAQMNSVAFTNSPNLTTVWVNGTERIEGRADLSKFKNISQSFGGTGFKEIVISSSLAATLITYDLPISLKTIITDAVSEDIIKFAQENIYNVHDSTSGAEYNYYVEIPADLTVCGPRAAFDFDSATGTLTVVGAGVINDIVNYYGGGSKAQPWFDIKQQIKHVVLDERITSVGKYAFCECKNLETVQIPNVESFFIRNGAFEKCESLRSIYASGSEPIEGTLDLRNVHSLESWSFAYDHLIANVVISPLVEKIGSSVFEETLGVNLVNIYGTPVTYAESFAADNGLNFYDISASSPQPITCVPPVSTEQTETTEAPETTDVTAQDTEKVTEMTAPVYNLIEDDGSYSEGTNVLPIIITVTAVLMIVFISVAAVLILKKKKK